MFVQVTTWCAKFPFAIYTSLCGVSFIGNMLEPPPMFASADLDRHQDVRVSHSAFYDAKVSEYLLLVLLMVSETCANCEYVRRPL